MSGATQSESSSANSGSSDDDGLREALTARVLECFSPLKITPPAKDAPAVVWAAYWETIINALLDSITTAVREAQGRAYQRGRRDESRERAHLEDSRSGGGIVPPPHPAAYAALDARVTALEHRHDAACDLVDALVEGWKRR